MEKLRDDLIFHLEKRPGEDSLAFPEWKRALNKLRAALPERQTNGDIILDHALTHADSLPDVLRTICYMNELESIAQKNVGENILVIREMEKRESTHAMRTGVIILGKYTYNSFDLGKIRAAQLVNQYSVDHYPRTNLYIDTFGYSSVPYRRTRLSYEDPNLLLVPGFKDTMMVGDFEIGKWAETNQETYAKLVNQLQEVG